MPGLLSKSTLRSGGSNTYIQLSTAQPQLPPTPTTSTGYTVVTDDKLVTTYRTSLGNLEMVQGTIFSNIPNHNITLAGTGTGVVVVTGKTASTSTNTGALVVDGGIGTSQDIFVNGIQIGQGFEGYNNITIRGAAQPIIVDANDGQENITVGQDSLLGMITAYKNIAVGRYTLSTGSNLSENIAIGDSALQYLGTYQLWPLGPVVGLTQSTATVVTVSNHNLKSGVEVKFTDLPGDLSELNEQNLWVKVINSNQLALYLDNILYRPLDTSGFTLWTGGGNLGRVIQFDQNIALGVSAAKHLLDGEQNLFIGDNVAEFLTTGSYNILLGHEVGNNMRTGSGNIAIGGDNLIDGLDNQVNIGSVFYFDGGGNLYLNSDTVVGLGTNSTGTTNGALSVVGGAGVTNDLYVGGTIYSAIQVKGGDTGSLAYQASTNTTAFLSIGTVGQVLLSDGTVPYWGSSGGLSADNAVNSDNILVNTVVPGTTYYFGLTEIVGDYSPVDGDTGLTYETTSTTNANKLTVPGSVYSVDGNPAENYKLYTPKVTVTNTGIPPLNSNVGDFWIDTTIGGEMQYIQDGTNFLWLQITTI